MSYQVIGYPICPYVHRILIAMRLKNIEHTLTFLNPHEELPLWFKEYSPLMKIPVIKTPSDDVLFESLVILEYLEEAYPIPSIHPPSIIDRAINRAWTEVSSMLYFYLHNIVTAKNSEEYQLAINNLVDHLAIIEKSIHEQAKFFNSNTFGMVDIILAPFFLRQNIIAYKSGTDLIAQYPKLNHLRTTIMEESAVQSTIFDDLEIQIIGSFREHNGFLFK